MLKVGRMNFSFAAAHHLPYYDGPCHDIHGHNYKLDVEFAGMIKADSGMIADFKDIKKIIQEIIDQLDHKCLNDLDLFIEGRCFPNHNPTAELMVLWLMQVIQLKASAIGGPVLIRLRLWETDNCYAEWEAD